MTDSKDTRVCDWLARFQHLEMTEQQVADPAATITTFSAIIDDLAKDLDFDTDPASFTRLLFDLAPDDLKSGDLK